LGTTRRVDRFSGYSFGVKCHARLFTDDFVSDTSEVGGKLIVGADDFVALTRKGIGRPAQAKTHQVHAPEIELTSATTARGVWALQDDVSDRIRRIATKLAGRPMEQ
jgi:hypothetical protein